MEYYFWIKWFHFIAFISWMAFLFYQPRLYVYHAENMDKPDFVTVVKVQERKMYNYIGYPSLICTLLSGMLILVLRPDLFKYPYMHIKLTCAILMIAFHFVLGYYLREFRLDLCKRSGKYFRLLNEVPTILMLIIIYAMIIMPTVGQ